MLVRLTHVIVYCSDMKRSIAFYRDQLGFPVKLESAGWAEFHSGSTTLALRLGSAAQTEHGEHGERRAGQAEPSLEVLDLDRFYEEKRANGMEFVMAPAMQVFGPRIAILLDPDGLPIRVTEERR